MSNHERIATQNSIYLSSVGNSENLTISFKKRRNISQFEKKKVEKQEKSNKSMKNQSISLPMNIISIKNPKSFKEIYNSNLVKNKLKPINFKIKSFKREERTFFKGKNIQSINNFKFANTVIKFDFKSPEMKGIVSRDRIVRKHQFDTNNLISQNSLNSPHKNNFITKLDTKNVSTLKLIVVKSPNVMTPPSRNNDYINLKYTYVKYPKLFSPFNEKLDLRYISKGSN